MTTPMELQLGQAEQAPRTIALLGGTGDQGRGLGARWAVAGHAVVLGSRDAGRALEAAAQLREELAAPLLGTVTGAANADACASADAVVVTVPYEGMAPTLEGLADVIAERLVVCCVNWLGFDARGPFPQRSPAGSAAQECAQLLPRAAVVSAFSNVSARKLLRHGQPVDDDVLVCGDDAEAKAAVARLVRAIPGLRPVDAGPLRLAGTVEDLTAVLVAINRRYKVNSGVRVAHLGDERLDW